MDAVDRNLELPHAMPQTWKPLCTLGWEKSISQLCSLWLLQPHQFKHDTGSRKSWGPQAWAPSSTIPLCSTTQDLPGPTSPWLVKFRKEENKPLTWRCIAGDVQTYPERLPNKTNSRPTLSKISFSTYNFFKESLSARTQAKQFEKPPWFILILSFFRSPGLDNNKHNFQRPIHSYQLLGSSGKRMSNPQAFKNQRLDIVRTIQEYKLGRASAQQREGFYGL